MARSCATPSARRSASGRAAAIGCEVVNEPGALIRNDLVTPTPEPARQFYAAVFDFTLDE